jgi:phosphomethylpyrimidine synthase
VRNLTVNPPRNGEGDQPKAGGGGFELGDAKASIAAMCVMIKETGSELYVGSGNRD